MVENTNKMVFDDYKFCGLKPLVKWSGGKSAEIKQFCHHIPSDYKLYIEPFVGGGALFFNLGYKNNLISDVHEDLINFYNQIKLGNGPELYKRLSEYTVDEKTYYFIRDTFIPKDDIDKALCFYYLRKTSFRGMLRYNKKGKFNVPWGKYSGFNASDLNDTRYRELLKCTDIRLASFETIFEEFDNEENFVFLDPPYDSEFTDYGYCQFGKEYQENLANIFKKTNNRCLMIIGKTPFIEELYKGYIVEEYYKKYSFKIYSGRIGSEINNQHLIIKNY